MRALKIIGKVFLHIISVLLCIVLFASTLVTMLVADVKVATNKDNLQKVLSSTLSAPTWQMGPITAASGAGFDVSSGNLSDYLVEFAYESVGGSELPFTIEDVKAFVEESTLKDFIAEKSASIISDIYTGENTTSISPAEIQQLLTENKTLIKKHFDVELTDEDIQAAVKSIEEIPAMKEIQEVGIAAIITGTKDAAPDEDSELTTGTSSSTNSTAEFLDAVRTLTSDTVLLVLIGVCAVLVGLLFLCAWNKPYSAMFYSGSTFTLAGLIFLVPTLIAWLAAGTWLQLFGDIPMVGPVSRIILMLTGGVCGAVTGLGVALIAGAIVLKVAMNKKKAAKALAAQIVEEAPAEETPVEEIPAEETPVEEVPAEEIPAEEAPTEEAPAEEVPAEETV
jgi:hypothetical protein